MNQRQLEELLDWLETYCLPKDDCTKAEAIQKLRKIKYLVSEKEELK